MLSNLDDKLVNLFLHNKYEVVAAFIDAIEMFIFKLQNYTNNRVLAKAVKRVRKTSFFRQVIFYVVAGMC